MDKDYLIELLLLERNPKEDYKQHTQRWDTWYSSSTGKPSGKILQQIKQRKLTPVSYDKIEADLSPDEWNTSLPYWLSRTYGDGYVYIIHFEEPYYHANHYTGYTNKLDQRIVTHAKQLGSKLMRTIQQKKKRWIIARIFPKVNHFFELYLKQVYKKVGHFCPFCKGSLAYRYFQGKHDSVTLKLLNKYGLPQYANYIRDNKFNCSIEELLLENILKFIL